MKGREIVRRDLLRFDFHKDQTRMLVMSMAVDLARRDVVHDRPQQTFDCFARDLRSLSSDRLEGGTSGHIEIINRREVVGLDINRMSADSIGHLTSGFHILERLRRCHATEQGDVGGRHWLLGSQFEFIGQRDLGTTLGLPFWWSQELEQLC